MDIGSSDGLVAKEKTLLSKIHNIIEKGEVYWKQHSRNLWLHKGDKNTRFFRMMASRHKKRNIIFESVLDDGFVLTNEDHLAHASVSFFHNLLNPHPTYFLLLCSISSSTIGLSSTALDFIPLSLDLVCYFLANFLFFLQGILIGFFNTLYLNHDTNLILN